MSNPMPTTETLTSSSPFEWGNWLNQWHDHAVRSLSGPERELLQKAIVDFVQQNQNELALPPQSYILPEEIIDNFKATGFCKPAKTMSQPEVLNIIQKIKDNGLLPIGSAENVVKAHDHVDKNFPEQKRQYGIENEQLFSVPELLEFANIDWHLELVERYLGAVPTLVRFDAAYDAPENEGKIFSRSFHCDKNSFSFVKMFLHLSDVDEKNAHEFILKTHTYAGRQKFLSRIIDKNSRTRASSLAADYRLIFSLPDEVKNSLNEETKNQVKKITGASGAFYFEDTRGFHRGPSIEKNRLFSSFYYTLDPVPRVVSNRMPISQLSSTLPDFAKKIKENKRLQYINRFLIDYEK